METESWKGMDTEPETYVDGIKKPDEIKKCIGIELSNTHAGKKRKTI